MEALTAATVAALTVYDMAKAIDDGMELTEVRLVEKTKEPVEGRRPHRLGRRRHGRRARMRAATCSRSCCAARASRSCVASSPTSATRSRRRSRSSRAKRARSDHRRHRPRAAGRDARGDARPSSIALAPGIAEAIRADSIAKTPHALLSRGVAGVRGQTLVVNLPGSTGGCRDGFAVLRPALEHALKLLAGEETAHRQT